MDKKRVHYAKALKKMNVKHHSKLEDEGNYTGCIICGKPIIYEEQATERMCVICHKNFASNAACIDGHFVCDLCHGSGVDSLVSLLLNSGEKSPSRLLQQVFNLPEIHMHGPEHHRIVPGVLLTAFYNNGGNIDLGKSLSEAMKRGKQVPGGTCGFWGVCGSAVGVGIYASIVTGSNPLNGEVWHLPQQLSSRCLSKIAEVGGPRCCKRTSLIAIEESIRFTKEKLGISMPEERTKCTFSSKNKECLKEDCPYYSGVPH